MRVDSAFQLGRVDLGNGVGFDGDAKRGSGLTNMQDRVDALGGTIEVRSTPGRGTVVAGWLPLEVAVR